MKFFIVTLFPKTIEPYINASILSCAQKNKKISIQYFTPRDFTKDKHGKVDCKPYGGGPGMVMSVDPIARTVSHIIKKINRRKYPGKTKIFILAAYGRQLTNTMARRLALGYDNIILIAGRYEGIDARVKKIFHADEISIGPYVLTGGELPAAVTVDVISRQIEGVLGNKTSLEENRVSSNYAYTRPEVYEYDGKKYRVPKTLISGNHKKIGEWRKKRAKK